MTNGGRAILALKIGGASMATMSATTSAISTFSATV